MSTSVSSALPCGGFAIEDSELPAHIRRGSLFTPFLFSATHGLAVSTSKMREYEDKHHERAATMRGDREIVSSRTLLYPPRVSRCGTYALSYRPLLSLKLTASPKHILPTQLCRRAERPRSTREERTCQTISFSLTAHPSIPNQYRNPVQLNNLLPYQ